MNFKGILYTIDNILCITSTLQIDEVIQSDHPTPLPLTKNWLMGVIQLRGHIIPITNLLPFSSNKEKQNDRDQSSNNILIVSHDYWQYGFKVTKLLGIRDIESNKQPVNDIPNELKNLSDIIDGVYETSEGYIYELCLQNLVHNSSFMNPQIQ